MTHVYFDLDKIDWAPYFAQQQRGFGSQTYEGEIATPKVFRGMRYVRGYGAVRNVLGSLGRFLMPIATNLMDSAKREAVSTLGNISQDIAEGRPLMGTLKEQSQQGLKRIGEKLEQCGKGARKRKNMVKRMNIMRDLSTQDINYNQQPTKVRRTRPKDVFDIGV